MRFSWLFLLLVIAGLSAPVHASCVVSLACTVVTGTVENCRPLSVQGKPLLELELSGTSVSVGPCDGDGLDLSESETEELASRLKSKSHFHFEAEAGVTCAALDEHVSLLHAPLCCDTPPHRGECALSSERAVLREIDAKSKTATPTAAEPGRM